MPTTSGHDRIAQGWESFLSLHYRDAFATALSVFGLSTTDFRMMYLEEATVQPARSFPGEWGPSDRDQDLLIEGLELLVEAGAVTGYDVGAFEFACDLVGIPRGFWEFVDPFLVEDVSGMKHSAFDAFEQSITTNLRAGNRTEEKSTGDFDIRLAGQRELLAQLLIYVHAIATPLKLSTVGLLPASISESHREQILQLAGAISPPSHCPLSFDRLRVDQQDRMRLLFIRAMMRCGLSSRSFAVFRGSYSEVFQRRPDCLPSSVPIAGAASRLESLSSGRQAVAEVRWLFAAIAAGRLHNGDWRAFACDLLFDTSKGKPTDSVSVDVLVDDLLARPQHLVAEDYRSALLILRSTQGLEAARTLAKNLQARLSDGGTALSRHVCVEVLRVSSEWGFDSVAFRSRVMESNDADQLGFGKRRAVGGFSIIELMRQKATAESLAYYVNELRTVIDSEEKLGNTPLACTLRIRRAEALVAIGEWSDAADEVDRMLPFDAPSDALDDIIEKLWDGHVLFDEPITALVQFCRSVAVIIAIGLRRNAQKFVDQIQANTRVAQCLDTLDFVSMRHVVHPVYSVEAVWARLRCLKVNAPNILREFSDAVDVVLDVLANDIATHGDRRLVLASAMKIRSLICEIAEQPGSIAVPEWSPSEIVLCLELLDHNLKFAAAHNAENRNALIEHLIPAGARGTSQELNQTVFAQQPAYFSRLTEFEYEESDDDNSSETPELVLGSPFGERPRELERSIAACLGRTGLWVKTLFLDDGQLRWWAFTRKDFDDRLTCITHGGSSPGARRRIELENAILDATLEAIWTTPNAPENLVVERFWREVDPSGYLTIRLLRLIKVPGQFDAVEREEILHGASRALVEWRDRLGRKAVQQDSQRHLKLPDCFKVAEQLLAAFIVNEQAILDRLTMAWSTITNFIQAPRQLQRLQTSTQIDDALNAACRRHREGVGSDFCLAPLAEVLNDSKLDVLISLDGPLASCPAEWLCVADTPLCELTSSCTSLTSMRRALNLASNRIQNRNSRELFAAMWEEDVTDRQWSPLNTLNNDLHGLAREYDWKCRTAFDWPLATKAAIESTLFNVPFDAVVIAGHGVARVKRKSYRYGIQVAGTDAAQRAPLWTGRGDFRTTSLVVLCSCDVGRSLDDKQSGFRGLYEELVANGAQCVCGARWAVHAGYAVGFATAITRELFECIDKCASEGEGHFWIARMINRVRREFLKIHPHSEHAVSAFSLWGIAGERAGHPSSVRSDSETGCDNATNM